MHILTCNEGDTIGIENDITVRVLSMKRGSIQVGISAPRQTLILRGELGKAQEETPEVRPAMDS
jgi:carbon storage regulator CsrA